MKIRLFRNGCLAAVTLALLTMTGCENGNLFGRFHDVGSGDLESLAADAANALQQKNYSQALSIYEQILNQDPNNSEALYGAAAAALGTSGLSLGQIISNILTQTSGAPSIHGLNGLVQAAQNGVHSQTAGTDSLLYGINLTSLDSVIDLVICRLQKIASGTGDGSIPPNDVDTLVNLGVLCALRATLDSIQNDLIDITNVNGTWGVTHGSNYGTFCADSTQDAVLLSIATDICASYAYFAKVLTILGPSASGGILEDLTTDLDSIGVQLFGTELPGAGCSTELTAAGINSSTFKTYFNPTTPPSGC